MSSLFPPISPNSFFPLSLLTPSRPERESLKADIFILSLSVSAPATHNPDPDLSLSSAFSRSESLSLSLSSRRLLELAPASRFIRIKQDPLGFPVPSVRFLACPQSPRSFFYYFGRRLLPFRSTSCGASLTSIRGDPRARESPAGPSGRGARFGDCSGFRARFDFMRSGFIWGLWWEVPSGGSVAAR